MSRKVNYPLYKWDPEKGLFAFTSAKTMYRILNRGSNTNPGVTIDHYITRRMVLNHLEDSGHEITREKYIELYTKIFNSYLEKITAGPHQL
jgi:23S rRNA G2069 N7-methylase RlmK/C1962 C5-methylase RlmI